ncbi:hypothetical protein PE36_12077 [Moritella sp. PE36]|nr:hypothetical protein PE36_12077 [Moritella sp. PE36]
MVGSMLKEIGLVDKGLKDTPEVSETSVLQILICI